VAEGNIEERVSKSLENIGYVVSRGSSKTNVTKGAPDLYAEKETKKGKRTAWLECKSRIDCLSMDQLKWMSLHSKEDLFLVVETDTPMVNSLLVLDTPTPAAIEALTEEIQKQTEHLGRLVRDINIKKEQLSILSEKCKEKAGLLWKINHFEEHKELADELAEQSNLRDQLRQEIYSLQCGSHTQNSYKSYVSYTRGFARRRGGFHKEEIINCLEKDISVFEGAEESLSKDYPKHKWKYTKQK